MSADTLTGPTISFSAYDIPQLTAGKYVLNLSLGLSVTGTGGGTGSWTPGLTFYVAAPRFSLAPEDVYSFFPPDQDSGIAQTVLPSITLNRSSLPWERSPGTGTGATTLKNNTWLALLLFDESEMDPTTGVSVSNMPLSSYTPPGGFLPTDDQSSQVSILSIPTTLATAVIPPYADLQWLAHIRQSNDSNSNPDSAQRATILCNRLPLPGSRSYVFLVSLEGQYVDSVFTLPGSGNVQLPVMVSWQFSTDTTTTDFIQLLENLNIDPPTLRMAPLDVYDPSGPDPETWLAQGYVALPHNFRNGESSVSWFHGPLGTGPRKVPLTLPAASADALLIYDSTVGMFDTAYAAAWQLGRMLALQDQSFAYALYEWKQQAALLATQGMQAKEFAYLPVVNAQNRLNEIAEAQVAFLRLNQGGTTFVSLGAGSVTMTASAMVNTWMNDTFGTSISLPSGSNIQLTVNNAVASFTGDFSVSFWFYAYPQAQTGVLFELDQDNLPYVRILVATGMLQANINGTLINGPTMDVSGWQQVVLSSWIDSGNTGNIIFEIYLSGVLVITQPVTLSGNAYTSCNMAYDTTGTYGPFSGNLANLRMFTEALEQPDVTSIMQQDLSAQTLFPFFNNLALLYGLPFNYLVNNEAMLPQESIRFFSLDMTWINSLLDGAFSIGRLTPSQIAQDTLSSGMLGLNPLQSSASGFLIRSQVISAWPDMQVNGYATNLGSATPDISTAMPILRIDRVSQNVLLCIFSGQVQTVDLHLAPQALHSGVDSVTATTSFTKAARNPDGSMSQLSVIQNFINTYSVISMNGLADGLNGLGLNFSTFASSELGMQMIEGVPNVRFNIATI